MIGCRVITLALALKLAYASFNYTGCGGDTPLAAGERASLCVHINGRMTAVFNAKVDQYDSILVQGSNFGMPSGSGYIREQAGWISGLAGQDYNCTDADAKTALYLTIDVEVGSASSSTPRIYKKIIYEGCGAGGASEVFTFPLMTAIVSLDKGVPSFIEWDDGCFFCASNGPSCMPSALDTGSYAPFDSEEMVSCSQPSATCYPQKDSVQASPSPTPSAAPTRDPSVRSNVTLPAVGCDLKVFVVWTGTDREGEYLTSAGRRFSRFRQYSTASTYQGALFLADDIKSTAQQAVGLIDGVPGRLFPGTSDQRRLKAEPSPSVDTPIVRAAAQAPVELIPFPKL